MLTLDSSLLIRDSHMSVPSPWRAWSFLLLHSWQRLARARLMLWIALGLLLLFALVVYVNSNLGRYGMGHWRLPRRGGPTFTEHLENMHAAAALLRTDGAVSLEFAVYGSVRHFVDDGSRFYNLSNFMVFSVYATFLLPLWTLSFATEGLGRPREVGNIAWLLTRPLPRWSVYLATFLAALPWCLLFNVGGLWLLCAAAGDVGRQAYALYWPAVLWGTLAFASLFHLMGACVRRPSLMALLYAMFLESIAGNLPRHFKRLSISYYMRCLMFDRAHAYGIQPENPAIYVPVSGATALAMLWTVTFVFLAVGMVVFSRREYRDV
ncbi:MAG: ABC transporter permease subunit [Gemmataceae bacterium]